MLKQIFFRFLCFLVCVSAYSADFSIRNDRLYISGRLENRQSDAILQVLDKTPGVKTIVFEECLGGQVGAAFFMNRVIREKGLNTMIKGQSLSSCALAFLAGRKRLFHEGVQQNIIMLHMPSPKNGITDSTDFRVDAKVIDLIGESTNGKMTESVFSKIRISRGSAAGVYFVFRKILFVTMYTTVYCDGTEGAVLAKCQELENSDLISMGILTSE